MTSTVLLSSLLSRPHPDVPLVNPVIFSQDKDVSDAAEDTDIKVVKPFRLEGDDETCFVAYNSVGFHVLQPFKPSESSPWFTALWVNSFLSQNYLYLHV